VTEQTSGPFPVGDVDADAVGSMIRCVGWFMTCLLTRRCESRKLAPARLRAERAPQFAQERFEGRWFFRRTRGWTPLQAREREHADDKELHRAFEAGPRPG